MLIEWQLYPDAGPLEPIGDIKVSGIDGAIAAENQDLDLWLGALVEGFTALLADSAASIDLVTEPSPLRFVRGTQGLMVSWDKQVVYASAGSGSLIAARDSAQALINHFSSRPRFSSSGPLTALHQRIEASRQAMPDDPK